MNKPVIQLKQLPRPAVSDLRLLRKILDEAREVKDDHWSHDVTLSYLNDAQHLIDGGEWSRALAHAKKAEANETQYSKRNLAEQYHTLLKGLYIAYAQNEKNNATQKESLKQELAEKKERKDESPTATQLHQPQPVQRARAKDRSTREEVREVHNEQSDGARWLSGVPMQSVLGSAPASREVHDQPGVKSGDTITAQDLGVVPQDLPSTPARATREQTPDHPYLIAQRQRGVRAAYWQAIADRDTAEIETQARLCREMGLDDVLAETRAQLGRIEEEVLLQPRRVAVQAWEGIFR